MPTRTPRARAVRLPSPLRPVLLFLQPSLSLALGQPHAAILSKNIHLYFSGSLSACLGNSQARPILQSGDGGHALVSCLPHLSPWMCTKASWATSEIKRKAISPLQAQVCISTAASNSPQRFCSSSSGICTDSLPSGQFSHAKSQVVLELGACDRKPR